MPNYLTLLLTMLLTHLSGMSPAAPVELANNGKSAYKIVIAPSANAEELQAAHIFQSYFKQVTSVQLPITQSVSEPDQPYISIGETSWTKVENAPQAYTIEVKAGKLQITGGKRKGVIYGVYTFIEEILGCRKWNANEPAVCPRVSNLTIDSNLLIHSKPAFEYREAYFPAEADDEYLDWHKLHRLDDLWGMWGHSFNQLVPAKRYFRDHPEYFSFYLGERRPLQLCLTNKQVIKIAIATIRKKIKEHTNAIYWSISANDDVGTCECDHCSKINQREGGDQGTLIRFVNAIAKAFPERIFTTLAYGSTSRAPLHTKPRPNVYIFLSSIDAYRTRELENEKSAAAFNRNLKDWEKISSHIFVWDYYTQFTNYLAPFPIIPTLQPNLNYFKQHGVSGVFAQGSGYDYSNLAELKQYLLAKLLWSPEQDVEKLTDEFLQGYYGPAAQYLRQYIDLQRDALVKSGAQLDIYGNPVGDWNTYLTPEMMDRYSMILDSAEIAAERQPELWKRVNRLRLSDEFAYLQQSRFYGRDRYGIWQTAKDGSLSLKPRMQQRVDRFYQACKQNGIDKLNEAGTTIDQYKNEWAWCFHHPPAKNLASEGTIREMTSPFVAEYATKGERTLIDGMYGFDDFSYNWLCFYGSPLQCTLDLNATISVSHVKLNFLEDQRHWIFRPEQLIVEGSLDGEHFYQLGELTTSPLAEDYTIQKIPLAIAFKQQTLRYIRVTAMPQAKLPLWRGHKTKKPMLACDEVWVSE
ncbi:DUF4838 domain-containing protein [Mangrovibacterium marinum]|uniref:Uncharacterized protein DUF4838 n=1 Tax=Mangrovibacterium marinum TaxID=1639118 RepID=A0A2T5BXS4_9BACT|nr:DUF4838 domain-containing protein [Mangrovibacterium marinum]PTN05956.1 uncharacterized protein DUF4838 [Mangrovibacterium marinum]